MKFNFCFTILLSSFSLSYAQNVVNTDSTSRDLNDVVVVAKRKPTTIADVGGTVWIVKNADIEKLAKNNVPFKEILAMLIPGMDVGGQGRSNYAQNMRGRSVLVMIDGISLNSLRAISRQLDSIDPFNIDRIEVLSGTSSIYGGNSTGGIINIITKKAHKAGVGGSTEVGLRSGLRHSNDKDRRIAQAVTYKNDVFDVRGGVAYQQNGGFYGANNKQIYTDISQTDLQYNQSIDLMLTGNVRITSKHKVGYTAQYYDSKFNGDRSLYLGDNLKAFTALDQSALEMRDGFTSTQDVGTKRWMGNLNYHAEEILGDQDLYVQLSTRAERLNFYPFPNSVKLASTTLPYLGSTLQNTDATNIKVLLNKNFNNIFDLSYGVDVDFEKFFGDQAIYDIQTSLTSGGLINKESFILERYPTIRSNSFAAYTQLEYTILSTLKLGAGLRYQKANIDVDNFIGNVQQVQLAMGYGKTATPIPGGKSNYDMFLPNVSLLFKPSNKQQAWINYTEGVSLADPAKYYGIGVYQYDESKEHWDLLNSVNVSNNPLQGIKTRQYEVGYRTSVGGFKAQASAFVSNSDKTVDIDRTTYQVLVKDQDYRNLGIEAELSYFVKQFTLGINGQYIKSQTKVKDQWQRQEVYNASPNKLVAYLNYDFNKFNVRYQFLNNFELKDELGNVIDDYNTSDIYLGYKLPVGRLSIGIQNVWNQTYQTVWSKRAQVLYASYKLPDLFYYQGRGRTFNINYTFTF